jgi:YD repeat-containing protein
MEGTSMSALETRTVRSRLALLATCLLLGGAAGSAETIVVTYDARGRVKSVVRSGTVNHDVQTTYQYDKADNRKAKTTSGSQGRSPS